METSHLQHPISHAASSTKLRRFLKRLKIEEGLPVALNRILDLKFLFFLQRLFYLPQSCQFLPVHLYARCLATILHHCVDHTVVSLED